MQADKKRKLRYIHIGRTVLWLSIFLILWLYVSRKLDPDFGWHLVAGDYYREYGIPAKDIFSYTAENFRWINHGAGNDVVLSIIYAIGGYVLASAFYALLWTIALMLSGFKHRVVVIVAALLAILPYTGIRAMTWTALFFSLLIFVSGQKNKKWRYCIPLIFIIWANLHGGFVIGLLYILYLLIRSRDRVWLAILVSSTLLTLLNPYGPEMYVEIGRTVFDAELKFQIAEWTPLGVPVSLHPYIILWVSGFLLYDAKNKKKWLEPSPALLLLALSSSRHFPLFIVASMKSLDDYFGKTIKQIPKKLNKGQKIVLAVICIALTYKFGVAAYVIARDTIYTSFNRYPVNEAIYLNEQGCDGRIFNEYNFGGYLIWKVPREKVYIDGRMPSWRDENGEKYMDRYIEVMNNPEVMKEEFRTYNVGCVVTYKNSAMHKSLLKEGWQEAAESNTSILLVK